MKHRGGLIRLGLITERIAAQCSVRMSEVWSVLGAVKTEFGKFGEVLDKVKRPLAATTQTMESERARFERRLRSVEQPHLSFTKKIDSWTTLDLLSSYGPVTREIGPGL
jgi:DNA anti-recombination protein RmuC